MSARKPRNVSAQDTAFVSSAGKLFKGIKLHPFTYQRQLVATMLGLKFGFAEQYKAQFYLWDVPLVLWLCSIEAEGQRWTVDRAEIEQDAANEEVKKFAKLHGIGVNSKPFKEGLLVFLGMMKEVQDSAGEPLAPEGEEEVPDSGEL